MERSGTPAPVRGDGDRHFRRYQHGRLDYQRAAGGHAVSVRDLQVAEREGQG